MEVPLNYDYRKQKFLSLGGAEKENQNKVGKKEEKKWQNKGKGEERGEGGIRKKRRTKSGVTKMSTVQK